MRSDVVRLREAVIGLVGFAALEEELLLAGPAAREEKGSPDRWSATAVVAHNEEFKRQQVRRLDAVLAGRVPPAFPEMDHLSERVYRRYEKRTSEAVARASRRTSRALVDRLGAVSDEDLLDPSRVPWLSGRKLWLQVVVRGFWHPTGHLAEYYLVHSRSDRAVAMQSQAVSVSAYLEAPAPARAMALYNLACAQARAGRPEEALEALTRAVELNYDLLENAARDADLLVLRERDGLAGLRTAAKVPEGAR